MRIEAVEIFTLSVCLSSSWASSIQQLALRSQSSPVSGTRTLELLRLMVPIYQLAPDLLPCSQQPSLQLITLTRRLKAEKTEQTITEIHYE